MQNLPTIRDVAAAAGVGIATVSRALNGHPSISPETRAKVLEAVELLGYRPNQLARTMKTQRSRTFGLIIPDIRNSVFPAMARGFEDEAHKSGYSVILADSDENPRREQGHIDLLVENRVAGVAFTGTATPGTRVNQLRKKGMPVVSCNPIHRQLGVDVVYINNVEAARTAVKHLLSLGHRHIAHLSAPIRTRAGRDRKAGYVAALEAAGQAVRPEWIFEGDYFISSGFQGALQLLQADPTITAIYTGNDLMALGALRGIKHLGLTCPGDVSLVGINNIDETMMVDPELSTVDTKAYEQGRGLAQSLIRQVEGLSIEPTTTEVPHELVVRKSTAPPRQV